MRDFLATILWLAGFAIGFALGWATARERDKRPASEEPCGSRRNPHQWTKWEDRFSLEARRIPDQEPVKEWLVQERRCERCGLVERRREAT